MPKVIFAALITLIASIVSTSALSITTLEKEQLITIRNQVFGGSTINASAHPDHDFRRDTSSLPLSP
ncbi:hypothetical protein BCU00_004035 [Vibrio breoganii]|uniref:hypothetical protein n=1 Tax=Vibrio breoganii TaxID=553239 RepID=UPI0039A6DEBF